MSETRPGLAPDEKRCPYCAETIKAAAVKCRFCQSDLPAVAAQNDAEAEAPDETAPALEDPTALDEPVWVGSAADPPGAEQASGRGPAGILPRLVAALLVLCLVLGGALWYLVDRSRHPDLSTAPNGQVTDNSFRNAAMSAAADAAARILSYSHQTFDADRAKARKLVTGDAAEQYEDAMDEVKEQAATAKLTLKATVMSVGTISVEEHRAKVLVFVNTYTTREGSKKQQLQQSRLVMDLTRDDSDWVVSQMDTI